ncbi:hypothetical protein ABZT08_22570 [Streptomyces sp. NPDC005526]|uniref:hypothetical protein n=1 Tax=Streptomyces sp. NPDC005526 TaxID=3156885 RepID=UPI0033B96F98
MTTARDRELLEVVTDRLTFTVAPGHEVRRRVSKGKPYTLYGYRLDPCPSFLANGHLLRQAW